MSVCIYPGSFNPVHNAHIEVAKYVHDKFHFEQIVFIPAFKPPHKDLKNFDVENAMHRLNMVELAVKDYPFLDVSAIEYTRNKPSYSYDTIVQLYEILKPKEKINFIIGTDAFIYLPSWYKTDELKKLVNFILFKREENFDETPYLKLKEQGYNYTLTDKTFVNISSSEIREKIAQGIDICDIVPLSVAKYIKENNVYKIQH